MASHSNFGFWFALGFFVLLILLLLPPTRAVLVWIFGNNRAIGLLAHLIHEVYTAHKVVAINLIKPRRLLFPSVEKHRTEKETR